MYPISILAGGLAAFLAFFLNRFCYQKLGKSTVWRVIPLIEEGLKTGLSWLMGANLIRVHGIFGLIEFLWDLFQPGRGQWLPGLMGFISHLFFGLLTTWVESKTGFLIIGFLATALIHGVFNRLMFLIMDQE